MHIKKFLIIFSLAILIIKNNFSNNFSDTKNIDTHHCQHCGCDHRYFFEKYIDEIEQEIYRKIYSIRSEGISMIKRVIIKTADVYSNTKERVKNRIENIVRWAREENPKINNT